MGGQSQDGGVGGCTVHVSSQLGHLPDAGGGPQHPRGEEEPPRDQVRCGGGRGEERWRPDGNGAPEGWLGEERDYHTWRGPLTSRESMEKRETLRGLEDWRGTQLAFSLPTQPQGACWSPGPGPPTSKAGGTLGPLPAMLSLSFTPPTPPPGPFLASWVLT